MPSSTVKAEPVRSLKKHDSSDSEIGKFDLIHDICKHAIHF